MKLEYVVDQWYFLAYVAGYMRSSTDPQVQRELVKAVQSAQRAGYVVSDDYLPYLATPTGAGVCAPEATEANELKRAAEPLDVESRPLFPLAL